MSLNGIDQMNLQLAHDGPLAFNVEEVLRDAYAVLLPAFSTADFNEESWDFFTRGGIAALLGSTREEYVARRMNSNRCFYETPEMLRHYRARASLIAGDVLIAIDYEIGGVHRLHDLGPQLSHPSAAADMASREVEEFGRNAATAAKKVGVNFFLSPVVDVVAGPNPWLLNRSISADPAVVARITSAFIIGAQSAGVPATAKHFPGHHIAAEDPFDSSTVVVPGTLKDLEPGFLPFRSAIEAGVKAIMTGPIPVPAIDDSQPSSTSAKMVRMLRTEFGFGGLIVSDDLDLPGTMRGRPLEDVAVTALAAGVELLLLASGPQVHAVAKHITSSAAEGRLDVQVLRSAAQKVRWLAKQAA
jgi:beta-N-acetylhexosaminidase